MPSLLTARFLLSFIDLSKALSLAYISRGLAAVPDLSHDLIINALKLLDKGDINKLRERLGKHTDRFLGLLDSLGLWSKDIGLSVVARKILNASRYKQYNYMRKILLEWMPMKVLIKYLSIVECATVDDIVNDLGWAMEQHTAELIKLGLIKWSSKAFQKPFNKHIVTAILLRLGREYEILRVINGKVYLVHT